MSSWERGYGDFEMVPDLDTLRPIPWHEGTALCLADLRWAGGEPVVASPRQILRAPAGAPRASAAWRPSPAPSSSSSSSATPTRRRSRRATASSKPANQYNVDYSLLGTARIEPLIRRIRNQMGAAGLVGGELQGRVQRRPARDQLPLRAGAADRRRALDLQDRGEGDRRPGGAWRSRSWPSTTSARGRRATSTCRVATGLDDAGLRALRRRPARLPARADAVLRAEHQLLQALRARLVRADRGRLGPRQPHVRGARGRPRRLARGSSCGCRAPTSTRTWRCRR